MKNIALIAFALLLLACNAQPEVFVRGIASVDNRNVLSMHECGTNRVLILGSLESNPLFSFLEKMKEKNVKEPIILDVMGKVSLKDKNKLLESRLLNFSVGNC